MFFNAYITIIVVGNEIGDQSSSPGGGYFHFTSSNFLKKDTQLYVFSTCMGK